MMLEIIETFVVAAILFAVIDLVWITAVVNKMYRSELGSVVLDKPRVGPSAAFYILYLVGLVYFAVWPALGGGSAVSALRDGALYGLFTYATFDLTCWAVLKAWTGKVVAADIAWGIVVSGAVSWLTYLVMSRVIA